MQGPRNYNCSILQLQRQRLFWDARFAPAKILSGHSTPPPDQEFTRWVGTRHTLDGSIGGHGVRRFFLSAMRTEEQGPFQPASERTFAAIGGHISRVAGLKARIDDVERKAKFAEEALYRLAYGFVVLDARAKAVLVNRNAQRLLQQGDILQWRQGRLAALRPSEDRRLHGLFDRTIRGEALAASSLRIANAEGRTLSLWLTRLPEHSPFARFGGPGLLLLIGDATSSAQVRPEDLVRVYALTPAEADLAVKLAAGRTVKEAAKDRGISYATARSQLYAVLEKTGVHRQADLTRLIGSLPGMLLNDEA